MATECPIRLEICDQLKKLHKKLPPQPPHLVCVNCYNKLKLRANVINLTEYDVYNICNQLVLSRNKRKGEHMMAKHPYITVCNNCIEKCKNICPICFSKIAFVEFWA